MNCGEIRGLDLEYAFFGDAGGSCWNCSNLGENGFVGNDPFSGADRNAAGKFMLFADLRVDGPGPGLLGACGNKL